MKKVVLLWALCMFSLITESLAQQNTSSYLAGNGVIYREGQMIRLYQGSRKNGTFRSMYWGNLALGDGDAEADVRKYGLFIKNIMKGSRVLFNVEQNSDGFTSEYILDIEKAIDLCEIWPCRFDHPISVQPFIIPVPIQPTPVQSVPPMPPPEGLAPAQHKTVNIADELTLAKALLDRGILTQKEFNIYKRQILTDGAPSPSPCEEIQKLGGLYKEGILTGREFERKKKVLLHGDDGP